MLAQRLGIVEIQSKTLAETVAQRRGQKPRTRGCADQSKMLDRQFDRPRGGSLADHDVNLEILHRRIENLLDDMAQAMDFIDEKDVTFVEIGEQRRQIAGALHHRPRCGLDIHAHLPSDDIRERSFAESRRSMKENMVEHVMARARRLDGDFEICLDLLLADVFVEAARPEIDLVTQVLFSFSCRRSWAPIYLAMRFAAAS